MTDQLELAAWFAEMGRELLSRSDVADTLHETCRLAVAAIDACQSAGVSQLHRGQRIETPAATTETVEQLHTLQYELNNGPCVDAAWRHHTVRIDDMTRDQRWPRFADKAAKLGVRSMLCFQLFTHKDTLGALNLFSDTPHAFDDHDTDLGLIFASHAAIALAGAQTEADLQSAVSTRQHIGEAVGILAERHDLTTHDAFRMLARASQHHNIRLRDLATRLVDAENAHRRGPADS